MYHVQPPWPGALGHCVAGPGIYLRMSHSPAVTSPNMKNQLKLAALIAATAITMYLCYRVIQPFLPAVIWAIALAIVALPLHRWFDRRLQHRTLAASLSVLVITLTLVIPVVIITQRVVTEATSAVRALNSPEYRGRLTRELGKHPRVGRAIEWVQQQVNVGEQAQTVAGKAGSAVPAAVTGSLGGLTQLIIALFTVFFLLRDMEFFSRALRAFVPLSDRDTDEVLARVKQTIDASVRGRVLIAVIQGALGGLMFWFLGLPAPLLWGSVMAVFALVPMLGAFVVWVPAALVLAITGHLGKAAILTGWGALVIGTADNVLYPMLVGKDLRLHTIVVFFSVLGGVAAFGASGLVIGPVIFAIADALIDIWQRRSSRVERTPGSMAA